MLGARQSVAYAIFAVLCLIQASWAEQGVPPAIPFEPNEGDVLVFLLDSDAGDIDLVQFVENFLITRFPHREFRMCITVVPERQKGKIAGLFREVVPHGATCVLVAPSLLKPGEGKLWDDSLAAFRSRLQELDRCIRDLQAEPTYLSPLRFDVRADLLKVAAIPPESWDYADATHFLYRDWLKDFATATSARFVDLHERLQDWTRELRGRDFDFTFLFDGHHPNSAGQLAIAAALLEDWGLDRPLSSIRIARGDENLSVTAEGGQVFDVHSENAQSVSFFWQADALPWVAPAELQSFAELLKTSERFSHETLQVGGLREGHYVLLIDDQLIGKFSASDFEEGISLERFATPQSEQAKAVAEANRNRIKTLILPAKELARLVAEQMQILSENAESSGEERRISAETRLAELQNERQRLEAAAESAWNQLRKDSQPIPRRFVIRAVSDVQVQGRVFVAGMPVSGAAIELHGIQGLMAAGTTDAMGSFELTSNLGEIPTGDAWLVVLAKMVLPKFVSLESSGHKMLLRAGLNEIELHFEEMLSGE